MAGVATAAAAVALAFWPSLTLIAGVVGLVLVLAYHDPRAALIAAIGVFLLEGTVKILLAHSGLVFDDALSVGAACLDVALFGAVLAVLARAPRPGVPTAWARLTTAERVVIGAATAWVLLSVVHVVASPSLNTGLSGFRLTHAYIAVAVASAIAFWDASRRDALVTALLWVLGLVLLYACVRGVIGIADVERNYATARGGVISYGGSFRAIGTLSGAIGLTTVAAPAAVFGAVLAVTSPRHRRLALAVAVLGVGAQVASLGRTPLVATVVALAFAAVLLLVVTGTRRRLVGAGIVFATCLVLLAAGAAIASRTSDALSERLEGLAHPASDESMQLRWENWRNRLDQASQDPFGTGLGTVGGTTAGSPQGVVTTDSSYLHVMLEQGFAGVALLLMALFGAVVLIIRRLMRTPEPARGIGLAALAGFAAFLVMMSTAEALEQPGKVLAWALLGLAVAAAWSPGRAEQGPGRAHNAPAEWLSGLRAAALRQSWRQRAAWITVGVVLVCAGVVPALARDSTFDAQAPIAVRGGVVAPGTEPPYLRQLLADPTFQYLTPRRADAVQFNPLGELSLVERARSGAFALRASSPTPARASSLLPAAGKELSAASRRDFRARVTAELQTVTGRRKREQLRGLLESPPTPVRVGPLPTAPEPQRRLDRFADALPGPFPQRADPVPLALVLAGTVLLAWLATLARELSRGGVSAGASPRDA